jgi:hypothetical protein
MAAAGAFSMPRNPPPADGPAPSTRLCVDLLGKLRQVNLLFIDRDFE